MPLPSTNVKDGLQVDLIAACDRNMGIGRQNRLPWRLPNEYAYFRRLTTNTPDPNKPNVVIMGRKNWQSIPDKFRPLPDRINIILTRDADFKPSPGGDNVHVFSSYEAALDALASGGALFGCYHRIWNIGGSQIYRIGFDSCTFHRLYLTRIDADFNCDVQFPAIDFSKLRDIPPDEDVELQVQCVPTDIQNEKGVSYKFHVYEKFQ